MFMKLSIIPGPQLRSITDIRSTVNCTRACLIHEGCVSTSMSGRCDARCPPGVTCILWGRPLTVSSSGEYHYVKGK